MLLSVTIWLPKVPRCSAATDGTRWNRDPEDKWDPWFPSVHAGAPSREDDEDLEAEELETRSDMRPKRVPWAERGPVNPSVYPSAVLTR